MDKTFVPIVLFVCITFAISYAIKLLVEARVRIRMLQATDSKELIETIVRSEEHIRRGASLRWGIVVAAEALAFGAIQLAGWSTVTPGVVALLLGAFGVGSLVYFFLSRRLGLG
ncbi:hypothetical protein [Dyella acidiphila]|uniref:Uncharacterized protein n=1 Tax=Dyella acidiphila TaxID=2775866 RepID=A0ABR9G7S8_9GAMM|nr:hypothetical protein [Dyella acidiphila]MBE1160102.1 hypothetical protein [Dyella acidiphila]